jgi:acetyl-CoA acetyltransferase
LGKLLINIIINPVKGVNMIATNDVVIVGMGRTPRGKFGGTLKEMDVIDLGASVIPEVLKRAKVKPEQVD